jgi:Cu(I)/Ag(I) efflux system membrane protein CusA/SilA
MSVAAAVGFIAMAGVAVETAIVMLIYIDQEMRTHWPASHDQLLANIRNGALLRLRPILMTSMTIIVGLIPIFLTVGPGSDVMRRIALPMVGGMASTLAMTLVLIPVIYALYMQLAYRFPDAGTRDKEVS